LVYQEEAMLEEKYLLEQVVGMLPVAVAIVDREMRYRFANDYWRRNFRLEDADLIGQPYLDPIPTDPALYQRCLAGETHRDEEIVFPHNDSTVDYLWREIRPWYTLAGDIGGIILYAEIITQRKQTEAALKAQGRFLRQVMDLNTSFIFAKDEAGRFTLVNKTVCEGYGSDPESMVGKMDSDFNPNIVETSHFRRDDLEVIRTRKPIFIAEEPVTHVPTGEVRWYQTTKIPLISEDGASVQLLGVSTDITARKRAEDALKAQGRFLRQIIDLNTSFIFAKDEHRLYTLVNKALGDAYGDEPENMVGKSDVDYNPSAEEVRNIERDDDEVLHTQQAKFVAAEPITNRRTKRTRWYQTTKIPLEMEDGKWGLLGVATDITERKAAEERLQQLVLQEQLARQEAEAASKMKDLFMANMSHELRTPLNAIIGFLREMLYSGHLDKDNTHMAERCLANSKRLLLLIESVLDLSRLATGSLEIIPAPIRIRELAQWIKDDLFIQANEKGLQLDLEVEASLPSTIIHDEERLLQITTNLVANAIKFTDQGGVKLVFRHVEDRLYITVTDTGVGITPEELEIIFEDFVQLDSLQKRGGVGLGLSIVKNLVGLMGGTVRVDSQKGQFSIFTVELPLHLGDSTAEL
jgi:PAS domain S-box-containing protein